MRAVYDDGGAETYRRARTLPDEVLDVWRRSVADLGLAADGPVVDVGSGPGAFLDALASWFGVPVVAVEPSAAMRREAATSGPAGRHAHLAATAEALPLRASSAAGAWLSTVVHQFDDRAAAAAELRRTVRDGGWVLVRGYFSDVEVTGLLASFPGIDRAASTFPSTEVVVRVFEEAGFQHERSVDVVEPWRFDAADWADRVRRLRPVDSALRPLTDDEVEEGVRRVLDAHGRAAGPLANDATLRLLVLHRRPGATAG